MPSMIQCSVGFHFLRFSLKYQTKTSVQRTKGKPVFIDFEKKKKPVCCFPKLMVDFHCNSPLTHRNKSCMQRFALYSQQNLENDQNNSKLEIRQGASCQINPKGTSSRQVFIQWPCDYLLPSPFLQTMSLWPPWRWTLRGDSWRTMWPGEPIAAGGPCLRLCTTASRLSGTTCTWTCTRPRWLARGSQCRRSARTASPRWPRMLGFMTACIRDLSETCQPPQQPYQHAPAS